MKVLFITKYFFPHIGGVEKHVYEVSKELIKNGIKVSIITEKLNTRIDDSKEDNNIKILRISYPKIKFIGLFVIWLKMFSLIREIVNADVIHIHDVFIWFLPIKLFFPFKSIYITFHGYEDYPIKFKYRIIRYISEKLCQGNICVGKFINKWYGTRPNIITYGAVDTSVYSRKRLSPKYKYDSVFVGRLDKHTGIDIYLRACKSLIKNFNFSLLVIGSGVKKIKSNSNIKYLGETNNVAKYLIKSKFAFVSRYLSILEAFACKNLVFAVFDNPIKEDYIRMTPFSKWLIICNNSKDLSNKVEFYIKNPLAADIIVNKAYNWVQKYSWKKLTKQYLRLWNLRDY